MRWLVVLVLAVGCGGHGAHGVGGDDDGMGDAGAAGDGNGNGSGNGNGNGNGSGTGDGSGSDGTVETGCAMPVAPRVTLSVTGSVPLTGAFSHLNQFAVFRAGDQIISSAVIDPAHYWQRWTGSGWNSEAIPWPANMPTNHNNYIEYVYQLASTRVLIVSDDGHIMTYDGHTMSAAVVPPTTHRIWGYAQEANGTYHVFEGTSEYVSKPDGTWYPPAPIPMPFTSNLDDIDGTAAIMRDGRVVVMYLDFNVDAPARHAHVLSYAPNGPWTAEQDITPTWRSNAEYPFAYAPPGGGIVLAVNLGMWRSTDGTTFGDPENRSFEAIAGECLDSLVIVGVSGGTFDTPGNWSLFDQQYSTWELLWPDTQLPAYAYDVVGVAALPSGKTFFVDSSYQGKTDYLVSP